MSFGYPSNDKCRICDGHKNNQVEPRFGYTVCEDHQNVPPAYIDNARKLWIARTTPTPIVRSGHEAGKH